MEVDLAVVAVVDVVIASDVVVEVLLTVVVVAISSTVVASVEGASVDDSSIVVASVVENPVVASSTVGCSVVETSAVGSSVVVGSVVDISVVGSSEEAVVSSVSDVGMPSVADEVAGSVVGNSVSIAVEISVVANSSAGEVVVSSEVDVDDMLNSSDEVILSSSSFPEGHSLATIIEASSDSSRRSCSSRVRAKGSLSCLLGARFHVGNRSRLLLIRGGLVLCGCENFFAFLFYGVVGSKRRC